MRRRVVIPAVALVAVIAVAVGLYLFQPWRIFTSSTVIEDVPAVATPAPASQGPSLTPSTPAAPVALPRELAAGRLISHEHATSGTVKLVRLDDGSHVVRLENLDTSNGPDLRVWLSDAPVKSGTAGWHVFDDGEYISLGELKGNKGNQNYEVPADVDPSRYTSVSIWCDRFDVSFGAAELTRV